MSHSSNTERKMWLGPPLAEGEISSLGAAKKYSLLQVTGEVEELERLERTISKHRLPPEIKPCILHLLNEDGPPQTLEKWKVPCIIAGELRRIGYDESRVTRALDQWGRATPSQVCSAVRTTFVRGYEFGCPTLEALDICLFGSRDDCPWFARIPRKSYSSYRERDFYRFGWPKNLRPSEQCIYLALREVEKKRRMPAGSRLYVSEREMTAVAGICRKTVRTGLRMLKKKGLIEFQSGKRHKHYGIAGTVRRIIPIPKPKHENSVS